MEKADAARAAGVKPPCVDASTSVAYYLGCAAPWTGQGTNQVLAHTPGGFSAWVRVGGLDTSVFVRRLPNWRRRAGLPLPPG